MKTLIKNGQVYMNRHFEKKDLLLDDRKIAVIGDFLEPEDADTAVYDAEGCYVTPGFIDVHTHGGFDVWMSMQPHRKITRKSAISLQRKAPHPGIALS